MEPTQELLQYIKQSLAAGFNREAIKKSLISSGWQEADVERGLLAVLGNSPIPSVISGSPVPVASMPGGRGKSKKLVLAGILILLVLGGTAFWWFGLGGSGSINFGSAPDSDSSIVKADSLEGTIYGPLDKFVDKTVSDLKKRSPEATQEEVADLTSKATKSYNDFRAGITAFLQKCGSFPAVATTSVSLNVDVLSKLGEEDPVFDQLKDSKLFPDVFTPGYAIYPVGKDAFDGCIYKDGGGGTTWNLLSKEEEYLAYYRAGDLAVSRRLSCDDLPTTTEKDGMTFEKEEIWSIVPVGDSGDTVYAGVRDGGQCLYKSNNGGASWNRVAVNVENMIPQNLDFKNLTVDPSDSAHLYATGGMFRPTEDSGNWDYQTVIESRDGGMNWSPVIIDTFQTTGVTLGSSGKLVYATAMNPIWKKAGSGFNGVRTDYFLYRSDDGGKTWQKITNCENGSILAVNSSDERIVYGVCGGVYQVSLDGGASWKNLLPDAKFKPDKFLVSGNAVYAMSSDFIYRSYDAGKTFEKIKTQAGLMFFEAVVSLANPKLLFILNPQIDSYNSDVYRSDDGGKTWQKFGPDLKLGLYDTIITISVDDVSKTLLVGTGKGLVRIPM